MLEVVRHAEDVVARDLDPDAVRIGNGEVARTGRAGEGKALHGRMTGGTVRVVLAGMDVRAARGARARKILEGLTVGRLLRADVGAVTCVTDVGRGAAAARAGGIVVRPEQVVHDEVVASFELPELEADHVFVGLR